jgi:hypothetical protein
MVDTNLKHHLHQKKKLQKIQLHHLVVQINK